MGPSGRIGYTLHILDCLGQDMQVLYLGRTPRTKETMPDFLKWRRVTRPPLVFRGLTGSQRTPGFWGVTQAKVGIQTSHPQKPCKSNFHVTQRVSYLHLRWREIMGVSSTTQ